jgi:class 3 adenylate cyclase
MVRLAVENAGGRLVNVTGDGTLSIFDGPARAVRCADLLRHEAQSIGIEIRAGVHTGEVERSGPLVSGMTVHIGARVAAASAAGEILVSRTVRDLIVGSGVRLVERGRHQLKGVPGRWELYAVDSVADSRPTHAAESPRLLPADRAAFAAARRAPAVMRTAIRLGNSLQRRRAAR